ncbi:ribonuclease HI family protein [Gracilibacillus salinarum]|uniref:Ribonuclease HI family protein n=1 Tax=Gracilibacillus salinarum TaxID=2932255 RepID=A0ABY4GNK7_9BACI|nr:ribonuclease HI family protein [Gracilibacillus salinarum]UOQ85839.1 ribonuclease HI family protein [Gracilibacillus salinarum]
MIEVYTDGASKGNPGPSGVGIYIKKGAQHWEQSHYIGEYSNHEAEFIAVIKALEWCQHQFSDEIVSCRSDAKVVVDAIEKEVVRNSQYQPYVNQIIQLAAVFPYFFMKWIPEKQNKHADVLARNAIAKGRY